MLHLVRKKSLQRQARRKLLKGAAAIGRNVRGLTKCEKILRLIFYGGKEAALAASRYIESHALILRKKTPYRPKSSIQPAHSVRGHASRAREWGVVPWHAKVETLTKKIGVKSGAA